MQKQQTIDFLKKLWQGFNYWRKTHWPFRLCIIILTAVPLCLDYVYFRESCITFLVRIACRSIEYDRQPRVVNAWMKYYRSQEKKRLQVSLSNIRSELSPQVKSQLEQPAFKADLGILFDSAKKHGILPKCADIKRMRRAMLAAATYEAEKHFRPEYDEVYRMIDRCSSADYTKWSTWENGLDLFIGSFFFYIFMPPVGTFLTWILICMLCGIIAFAYLPRFKYSIGIAGAMIMTFILRLSNYYTADESSSFSKLMNSLMGGDPEEYFFNAPVAAYQVIFGTAMVLFGIWIADKHLSRISKKRLTTVHIFLAGIVLFMMGVFLFNTPSPCLYSDFGGTLETNCRKMIWVHYAFLLVGGLVSVASIYLPVSNYCRAALNKKA